MPKIITRIITLFTILFYILASNTTVKMIQAQTIVFEDDFSNGFEKWESVRGNFDLWSIIDEQANVFINRRSTLAELVPKDFYWNPEWKNIVYELDYRYIEGADKNISFGFKDTLNWYEIHFVGGSYILSHLKNGAVVWDNSGYGGPVSGQVNHIIITLNEGSIIVMINGQELFNVVDPTFDNDYGKIGMKAGAGSIFPTHAIYDNIVVRTISNIINKLVISVQKQIDPIWASEEYDSADAWINSVIGGNEAGTPVAESEIGIDRWGCLVTSISMIMNFHGIDKMPSGEVVNPSTVNNWLNSQDDGYVGTGLVNWMAITRLTKDINTIYSTPKLEYKRVAGSDFTTTQNEILTNKPVVLQIPGHFLVGNGFIENTAANGEPSNADLFITDPAYTYEKFSQHQEPLLSTRTLQPTFTDLSYLHFNHNPNLNINITNEDGSEINNLQFFEDYIKNFVEDESEAGGFSQYNSPSTKIHEIEKPENGVYIVEISQEIFGPVDLTIFAYNKDGELSNLSYSGLVGQNKIIFRITYNNDGISSIEKFINFETLINDIDELFQMGEIKKHYVMVELQKYANLGLTGQNEDKNRYIDALQQLVEWYSPQFTGNGKDYLNFRLLEII